VKDCKFYLIIDGCSGTLFLEFSRKRVAFLFYVDITHYSCDGILSIICENCGFRLKDCYFNNCVVDAVLRGEDFDLDKLCLRRDFIYRFDKDCGKIEVFNDISFVADVQLEIANGFVDVDEYYERFEGANIKHPFIDKIRGVSRYIENFDIFNFFAQMGWRWEW